MQWIHKRHHFKNQASEALNPLVLPFGHLVVHGGIISADRYNSYSFAPWLLEIFNPAYGFKLVLCSIRALTIAGSKNKADIMNKVFFELSIIVKILEKPQGKTCIRNTVMARALSKLACAFVITYVSK